MKDKDIMHLLQAKKREAEEKSGYHISLMVLKGSQNYNCADENSDIDAVAFFVPTLEQLIDGKIVSKKLTMNDGAFIELKDIRLFTNLMSYSIEIDSPWQQEQTDRQSKREQRLLLSRQKRSLRIKNGSSSRQNH